MSAAAQVTCFLLFVAFVNISMSANEDSLTEEFEVKPGAGNQQFSMTLLGVTCTFSYIAQGGTKERWSFQISRSNNDAWVCSVERPGTVSYLFFEQFNLQVKGAKIVNVGAEKEPGIPLDSKEYVINKADNYVAYAPGSFMNKLNKLDLVAIKGKAEL